jgi:hypothetical protein
LTLNSLADLRRMLRGGPTLRPTLRLRLQPWLWVHLDRTQRSRGDELRKSQASRGFAIVLAGARMRVPAFGWQAQGRNQRQVA